MDVSIERQLADIVDVRVKAAAQILYDAIRNASPVGQKHTSPYPRMKENITLVVRNGVARITVPFPARFLEEGTKFIKEKHFIQGAVLAAQSSMMQALQG